MPITIRDSIQTLQTSLMGILLICSGVACDLTPVAAARQTPAQSPAAEDQAERPIQIENESDLPDTYPRAPYRVHFQARGGVPVLHWRVERGALPPGMKLEDNGVLQGEAERTGEFQFTVAVRDGGQPQSAVQKAFTLRVRSALNLRWKTPAHVNGNRIEGSVDVSNTTPDDIDLTFIAMAVAGNGRATAIGYQHFVIRGGTAAMELPFGDTLPHGGYVVHVDAVGEVPPKNLIYRDRMETPTALQVTVGP
jgi:hypothetical protein